MIFEDVLRESRVVTRSKIDRTERRISISRDASSRSKSIRNVTRILFQLLGDIQREGERSFEAVLEHGRIESSRASSTRPLCSRYSRFSFPPIRSSYYKLYQQSKFLLFCELNLNLIRFVYGNWSQIVTIYFIFHKFKFAELCKTIF